MALSTGSAAAGTGLAGAIFTEMNTRFGPYEEKALPGVYDFCDALGESIVDYIVANAELNGTDSLGGGVDGGII